ncbi:MAG TPA: methyl-accepting chemotaxis protein [Chromatiaceae bacterium]|nr:methyl-accepting chemotaxis protein [Chromatiaceae bacterium]
MFDIRSIGFKFNALNLLVLGVGLGVLLFVYQILQPIKTSFSDYRDQVARREQLLMGLRENFGYGGGIHNFKNYVIRGKEKYARRMQANAESLDRMLASYRTLPALTSDEASALDAVESTFHAYYKKIPLIKKMYARGEPVTAIDAVIKIDDGPALRGFEALESHYQSLTARTLERLDSSIARALGSLVWVILGGSLLMSLLIQLTRNSVVGPIRRAVRAMDEIADGDGDLTRRMAPPGATELDHFATAFNRFVGKVEGLVARVIGAASDVESAATRVVGLAEGTDQGTRRQQGEIEQAAAAVANLKESTLRVASNVEEVAAATNNADKLARQGSDIVTQAVAQVGSLAAEVNQGAQVIRELQQESQSIGTVLDVIRGIAEQTNLLALNAAIEAARAGEQGRGFAVVADEVRSLAGRTQDSTQEIQEMVGRLQHLSQAAVDAMELAREHAGSGSDEAARAGRSLEEITLAVAAISERSNEIAGAARAQSGTSETIHASIEQIARAAADNTGMAAETTQVASNIATRGQQLQQLVQRFKVSG